MTNLRIGMIGLGKLGLPCAEVFAERHDVAGYDVLPRSSDGVRIVQSIEHAVRDRDIVFIAVPTAHDPAYGGAAPSAHLEPKDFDYCAVETTLDAVNECVTPSQLVVLISTVLPGTVRSRLASRLSNARLTYNPYLIAMRSVKWDLVNPEMVIIGTEDGATTGDAARLCAFYRTFVNCEKYAIGTWDEAESIKIFYNTFISMKIGLVNMIQDVAEAIGHIDVDVVCDALKAADQRITGPRYLTPGMGDGGPCHPRDNIALRHLATNLDLGYDPFSAIMVSREKQARNLARFLMRLSATRNLPIVIFGKSYKPGVPYTDGSYSLLIAHFIEADGQSVRFADPCTGDQPGDAEPWIVLLAHDAAVSYPLMDGAASAERLYAPIAPGSVVVDPWRKFRAPAGVETIHFGNTRARRPGLANSR